MITETTEAIRETTDETIAPTAPAGINIDAINRDVLNTHGAAFFATASWLTACGKKVGDEAALSVQIGCHIEEFSEFLKAIYIESSTGITSAAMQELAAHLESAATALKRGYATAKIYDREAALDALCDTDVTGNGVAFLAGLDKVNADVRVIASNLDKFNPDGTPVLAEGGKILKRAGWTPPDLSGLF